DEQPIETWQTAYAAFAKDQKLTDPQRKIAEHRLKSIELRAAAKAELLQVRKEQQEMAARRQAMRAEQEELEQRIAATNVELYTAVGTLRVSSLQLGGGRLYRLTDP